MSPFQFHRMTKELAWDISGWSYEEPYNFYNPDPDNREESVAYILTPEWNYYAVT